MERIVSSGSDEDWIWKCEVINYRRKGGKGPVFKMIQ